MAKTYSITDAQKAYLSTFRCERLKADPENRNRIRTFENDKGGGLVHKLKMLAWKEDNAGSTAYYLIKDKEGEIVMFFSLKCGVLFDPNHIRNHMELFGGNDYGKMWDAILTEEEAAMPELRQVRDIHPANVLIRAMSDIEFEALELVGDALKYRRLLEVQRTLKGMLATYSNTKREKRIEHNQNIIRVPESFSAIELVEFCANKNTDFCWDEDLMAKRSMGVTMFWSFIVPKMLQINELIGSEYVFLFAADYALSPFSEKTGKLIQLYRDLHFDYTNDLGTAKPEYDFSCQFMCQRLRDVQGTYGLEHYMEEFFDHFNDDPNARDYT